MITNVELFNALRNVTAKREGSRYRIPVSYTHLTLPTIA